MNVHVSNKLLKMTYCVYMRSNPMRHYYCSRKYEASVRSSFSWKKWRWAIFL